MDSTLTQPPETICGRYVRQTSIGNGGLLGMGGFGSVWAYRDTIENRNVAIKTLPDVLADTTGKWEEVVENFNIVQECSTSRADIATMYSLMPDGIHRYLVMELIDGQNLGQWLQGRKQEGSHRRHAEWPEFRPLLRQICGALDFVHGDPYHIVHRDIKPANIMVDVHGNIKLLDFGIAQKIHSSISVTRSHGDGRREYVGSYPYMSPEQFGLVAASKLDGRSDQYSLAILTFEILSGTLPFEVDAFDALLWKDAHCKQACPDAEHLGAAANTVLKKALAKDREDRYENCLSFFNALDDAIKQDVLYITHREEGGGTPKVGSDSNPEETVIKKPKEVVTQNPKNIGGGGKSVDLPHKIEGTQAPGKNNHGVITLVAVVALLMILAISAMAYIGSGTNFRSLIDRWLPMEEQLKSLGLSDSKIMENLRTRIKTCEQAMNDNDFLILRKSTSMLKKEMDKVEECLKKYHEFQQVKTEAENAFVNVNFEKNWNNYKVWADDAKSSFSEGEYGRAQEKWNTLVGVIGEDIMNCDELSTKNTTSWQILDERIANLKKDKEIHKSLPEAWESFNKKYSGKTRLNRLGNYRESTKLCDTLKIELDNMEVQMSAKENRESVKEAKIKAENCLARIEFPVEMNELDNAFQQAQGQYEKEHNYTTAGESFKKLTDSYQKIANEATDNRKSLPEAIGKLQEKMQEISEVEVEKNQLFMEKLREWTDEMNHLIKEQDSRTARELLKSIETLDNKWEQLKQEVKRLHEQQKSAQEAFIKCQEANNHLKAIGIQQGNEKTNSLIEEWSNAEKQYQNHIRRHEFEKALELCQEWQKKYEKEFERLNLYWKDKAIVSQTEAKNYIDEIENNNRYEEFGQFIKDWQAGKKALNDDKYYMAYSYYEKVNRQFPIIKKKLKIQHFAKECDKFDKEQDWEELETIAGQWLEIEIDSKKAQTYLVKAKNGKNKVHLSAFMEANKKGRLDEMKKALDNWPEANPEDGDNPRNIASRLYDMQVTLKTSLETKEWNIIFKNAMEILDTKDTMGFGKECCLARESLGFCLESMRDDVKNNPQEARDRHVKAWRQLIINAGKVMDKMQDNETAKNVCDEAKKIRENANQEIDRIYRETLKRCHDIVRKGKKYDELTKQLAIDLEFLKSNYELNDDITKLDDFLNLCQRLHTLDNDDIENIIKVSDKLLGMYQDCAFADACKKSAQARQDEIEREKQKEKEKEKKTTVTNKRASCTIPLPNGQALKLLPVRHPDGYVFWMGECEVTQEQYASFYRSYKTFGISHKKFDDECLKNNSNEKTWFGETIKDMKSYINWMELPSYDPRGGSLPCHSICWDDAFAWCELLNQYSRQNGSLLIDNQYVLRLPRVSEWQAACAHDNNLLNENIKSKQLLPAETSVANSLGFHNLLGNVYEWCIEALSNEQRVIYVRPQIFSGRSEKKFERICLGVGSWLEMHDKNSKLFLTGDGGIYELEETVKAAGGISSKYKPRKKTKRNDIGFRVVFGPILSVR